VKRIVFLTCIGSFALALTAWGAPRSKGGDGSARGEGAHSAHVVLPRRGGGDSFARVNRTPRSSHLSATRASTHAAERRTVTRNRAALGHERNVAQTTTRRTAKAEATRARSSRVASREARTAERNRAALNRERNLTRANTQRTNRVQATQARNARVAQATRNAARRNLAVNWQRNLSLARNVLHNRAGNVRVTNNWRGARFNDPRYAAFYFTTGLGMIVGGGEITIRTSCLCWVGGGTGILATGIQPGAMTRTPGIRMTDQFTPATRI
jgi:hypothetical protein